jgi:uncharacterized protein YqeY
MSNLKQRINDDVKTAMRNKDKDRLVTLRMITAAIKQKEVDERIELDDTRVLAIIDKMARQHRDSIQQYESAGRIDLVDKEKSELQIVQSYLPEQLSDDEVKKLIQSAIQATGATTVKDMGKVMGIIRPQVQGRADMTRTGELVKALLA